MAPIITECSVIARPDRGIVEVYDANAYLGDETALMASRSQVVAGDGYHLAAGGHQPDIPLRVIIRIWPAPQQPPITAEGSTPISLESETGLLVINQLTYGPAGEMTLPRPGVYEGHAWWTGREAASAYYAGTLRQLDEGSSHDELGHAWSQCPADEQYVLDLHFTREPQADEDDEQEGF